MSDQSSLLTVQALALALVVVDGVLQVWLRRHLVHGSLHGALAGDTRDGLQGFRV